MKHLSYRSINRELYTIYEEMPQLSLSLADEEPYEEIEIEIISSPESDYDPESFEEENTQDDIKFVDIYDNIEFPIEAKKKIDYTHLAQKLFSSLVTMSHMEHIGIFNTGLLLKVFEYKLQYYKLSEQDAVQCMGSAEDVFNFINNDTE